MIIFLAAAAVVVGPIMIPSGVVSVSVRPFLNGTVETYARVRGIAALRAWWRGELQAERP